MQMIMEEEWQTTTKNLQRRALLEEFYAFNLVGLKGCLLQSPNQGFT